MCLTLCRVSHLSAQIPRNGSDLGAPCYTAGVIPPVVSQQVKYAPALRDVHPEMLLEAAAPVLTSLAAEHGYSQLEVFGSVALHQARDDSEIDLLIEPPEGTSSFDFIQFKELVEDVLGREIDLVSVDALKPRPDDDIRRVALLL